MEYIVLIFGIGLVVVCIYSKNRRTIFLFTRKLIFAFAILLLGLLFIKFIEQNLAPTISTKFFAFSMCIGLFFILDMSHSYILRKTRIPITVVHLQNLFKILWRHHSTVGLIKDFLSLISAIFGIKKLLFLLQREGDNFYCGGTYGYNLKEAINLSKDSPLIRRLKLVGYASLKEKGESGQALAKLDMDCAVGIFTASDFNGALLFSNGEKCDEFTLNSLRTLTKQFMNLLGVLALLEQQRYRFGQVALSLLTALEYKYPMHLKGHSKRVSLLATMLGKKLNLDKHELDELRLAAYLHDIGELHTPTEILTKTTKLTQQEFNIIKEHPKRGAQIVQPSLGNRVAEAINYHHERPDGRGYYNKRKDEVSLFAKILALCEVWDALTSDRPYRPKLSINEALQELERAKGIQLDTELVDKFSEEISCMMKKPPYDNIP